MISAGDINASNSASKAFLFLAHARHEPVSKLKRNEKLFRKLNFY